MSNLNIIRAWKDEAYRLSLSKAERARLPEHPAGPLELTDDQLGSAAGGHSCDPWCSLDPWWCSFEPTCIVSCGGTCYEFSCDPECTHYISCPAELCPF